MRLVTILQTAKDLEGFDAVISYSTLQYVDKGRVLDEVLRVLRPRGYAVFAENLATAPMARVSSS